MENYVTYDNDLLKTPLMKLKIDRTTLLKLGINLHEVDRLYRSIYVTSVSFFQTVS